MEHLSSGLRRGIGLRQEIAQNNELGQCSRLQCVQWKFSGDYPFRRLLPRVVAEFGKRLDRGRARDEAAYGEGALLALATTAAPCLRQDLAPPAVSGMSADAHAHCRRFALYARTLPPIRKLCATPVASYARMAPVSRSKYVEPFASYARPDTVALQRSPQPLFANKAMCGTEQRRSRLEDFRRALLHHPAGSARRASMNRGPLPDNRNRGAGATGFPGGAPLITRLPSAQRRARRTDRDTPSPRSTKRSYVPASKPVVPQLNTYWALVGS